MRGHSVAREPKSASRGLHERWFTLPAVFLVAGVLSACNGESAVTSGGSAPSAASDKPSFSSDPPHCPRIDVASDEYGTEINPTKGPPGTDVTLSGTTVRGRRR